MKVGDEVIIKEPITYEENRDDNYTQGYIEFLEGKQIAVIKEISSIYLVLEFNEFPNGIGQGVVNTDKIRLATQFDKDKIEHAKIEVQI